MANPAQLFLLADHIKLSLLERQRAISLDLEPNAHDGNISRSLESMREGIEAAEQEASRLESKNDPSFTDLREQAAQLHTQYSALSEQFTGYPPASTTSAIASPNNLSLSADFAAAQDLHPHQPHSSLKRTSTSPNPKSVRFTDNPLSSRDDDDAARAALFPYRDNPADAGAPDQTELSNQQIHSYHALVLREQDDQLDRLGESIGRQRDLSIQIGDELDEHVAMLDEVDAHVDRHQGRLDGARQRIGRIARKANDNKQITTIAILIIILILLIIVLK